MNRKLATTCVALVALTSFGAADKAIDRGVKPIPAELFGQGVRGSDPIGGVGVVE